MLGPYLLTPDFLWRWRFSLERWQHVCARVGVGGWFRLNFNFEVCACAFKPTLIAGLESFSPVLDFTKKENVTTVETVDFKTKHPTSSTVNPYFLPRKEPEFEWHKRITRHRNPITPSIQSSRRRDRKSNWKPCIHKHTEAYVVPSARIRFDSRTRLGAGPLGVILAGPSVKRA